MTWLRTRITFGPGWPGLTVKAVRPGEWRPVGLTYVEKVVAWALR